MIWIPDWLQAAWDRKLRPVPKIPRDMTEEAKGAVERSDSMLQEGYAMQLRAKEVGVRALRQKRLNHFGALLHDVYRKPRSR